MHASHLANQIGRALQFDASSGDEQWPGGIASQDGHGMSGAAERGLRHADDWDGALGVEMGS
ncbi:MAG TPA: hypothetical protein VGH96_04740 [Streptosporangiaceae bacterium]|jgi:hypothetical protein